MINTNKKFSNDGKLKLLIIVGTRPEIITRDLPRYSMQHVRAVPIRQRKTAPAFSMARPATGYILAMMNQIPTAA